MRSPAKDLADVNLDGNGIPLTKGVLEEIQVRELPEHSEESELGLGVEGRLHVSAEGGVDQSVHGKISILGKLGALKSRKEMLFALRGDKDEHLVALDRGGHLDLKESAILDSEDFQVGQVHVLIRVFLCDAGVDGFEQRGFQRTGISREGHPVSEFPAELADNVALLSGALGDHALAQVVAAIARTLQPHGNEEGVRGELAEEDFHVEVGILRRVPLNGGSHLKGRQPVNRVVVAFRVGCGFDSIQPAVQLSYDYVVKVRANEVCVSHHVKTAPLK